MSAELASGKENRTLGALLEATRPPNVALAGIGTTIGALAGGAALTAPADAWPLVAAFIVGATGTAGGNLLNDLMDVELDRMAHPERPLPSGRLRTSTGWIAVLVLFSIAIATSITMNPWAGLVAVGLVGLLVLYETQLKATGLPGNLMVAIAAGTLFPLGALIAHADLYAPFVLGALAALAHLGRELLKDTQDAHADTATRRTLAITRGTKTTTRLAAAAFALGVLLSPLPVPLAGWHPLYLALVAPALLLFLAAAWTGLRDPERGQRLAKTAMALALSAFLIGPRL